MDVHFAGEVTTSFNHVMLPTQGNWFQTKPLDYDFDNHADIKCVLLMVKI